MIVGPRFKAARLEFFRPREKLSAANNFFLTYMSPQTFIFYRHFLANNFFPYVFSVLFLVLNIAIAFLYHVSKNLINSAIATLYFVDIRSTHLF